MHNAKHVPLFRPPAILLAMLSLSIGWVYHGTAVGGNSPMNNMRFGEKADWYIKPVLKRAPHR